jgi:hypothetical protein
MTTMVSPAARVGLLVAIAAPIIWAVHFTAIYVINALACARGIAAGDVPLIITIVSVPAAVALLWLAHLAWPRADAGDEHSEPFLNRLGLLLCTLIGVAFVWNLMPVLLVPAC